MILAHGAWGICPLEVVAAFAILGPWLPLIYGKFAALVRRTT